MNDPDISFLNYIKNNYNFSYSKNDGYNKFNKEITHYLLSGGIISVTDELHWDFIQQYVNHISIVGYDNISISEQKSFVYKYFQDMDYEFKKNEEITTEQVIDHVITIQNFLKTVYVTIVEDNEETNPAIISKIFEVYILEADSKMKDENTIKKGYHIIWPNIRINKATGINMYPHLINFIKNKYPDYDWNNIIDIEVYRNNGLRMPYSNKVLKCCKDIDCSKCNGSNKIIENRPYILKYKLDGYGNYMDISAMSLEDIIKSCSIRLQKNSNMTPHNKYFTTVINESLFKKNKTIINFKMDHKWNIILNAIRKHERYKLIEILNVIETNIFEDKGYFINVIGEGSQYCHNIEKNHNSKKIYFMLTRKYGLCQRCHCQCPKKGKYGGLCKDFYFEIKNIATELDLFYLYENNQDIDDQLLLIDNF